MLQHGGLVGRVANTASDAVSAAAEGADLVLLEVSHIIMIAVRCLCFLRASLG